VEPLRSDSIRTTRGTGADAPEAPVGDELATAEAADPSTLRLAPGFELETISGVGLERPASTPAAARTALRLVPPAPAGTQPQTVPISADKTSRALKTIDPKAVFGAAPADETPSDTAIDPDSTMGLIARAKLGDRAAANLVAEKARKSTIGLLRAKTGNAAQAEDLSQTMLELAWKQLQTKGWANESHFTAWCKTVANHLVSGAIKKRDPLKNSKSIDQGATPEDDPYDWLADPGDTPEEKMANDEEEARQQRLARLLNLHLQKIAEAEPKVAEALRLVYFENMTVTDAAARFGVSTQSIYNWFKVGYEELKGKLASAMDRVPTWETKAREQVALALAATHGNKRAAAQMLKIDKSFVLERLPESLSAPETIETAAQLERTLILEAMAWERGIQDKAAATLGVTPLTLKRIAEKRGVDLYGRWSVGVVRPKAKPPTLWEARRSWMAQALARSNGDRLQARRQLGLSAKSLIPYMPEEVMPAVRPWPETEAELFTHAVAAARADLATASESRKAVIEKAAEILQVSETMVSRKAVKYGVLKSVGAVVENPSRWKRPESAEATVREALGEQIDLALESTRGDVPAAAELLGIDEALAYDFKRAAAAAPRDIRPWSKAERELLVERLRSAGGDHVIAAASLKIHPRTVQGLASRHAVAILPPRPNRGQPAAASDDLPGYDEALGAEIVRVVRRAGGRRELARRWLELDAETFYDHAKGFRAPKVERWEITEKRLIREAFEKANHDPFQTLRVHLRYAVKQYPQKLQLMREMGLIQ